jgi:hypothetical protein
MAPVGWAGQKIWDEAEVKQLMPMKAEPLLQPISSRYLKNSYDL